MVYLMGQLFSGDQQGTDSDDVRAEKGIVIGRFRISYVHKMAHPVETELQEPPKALSDEFIDDVNSRAFVWEVSSATINFNNL